MAGKELKYEIINQIGVISTSSSGWNTELNRVSWNGNEPKYDLRSWSSDHIKMGKGITISEEELIVLAKLLEKELGFLKKD
ncbi:MAG: PC4/YdbC family ssDNA-binding protein [Eubacteriales bacterium]|nr:PC4/YdbC family ssDNA-binding protein [Eubacteriales bacterium]